MFRSLLIFATLCCLIFAAACGSSSGDDAANVNSQSAALDLSQITDANVAYSEGVKLLDAGDADRAIEFLNRAVELHPDHADAYFQLGIAYSLVEKRDSEIVEEQVTPEPDGSPAGRKPATTNSQKAFEKAAEAYKKAIAANENDHLAYFNLGRAYNKLNDDREAARALRQAVKLNPEDTEYQTELGSILVKLAEYREAIEPLKKAIEIDPENSRAFALLEDAEAGRKRIDFVSNRNTNKSTNSNSTGENTNANSSAPPPPPANSKPPETRPTAPPTKATPRTAERPN